MHNSYLKLEICTLGKFYNCTSVNKYTSEQAEDKQTVQRSTEGDLGSDSTICLGSDGDNNTTRIGYKPD